MNSLHANRQEKGGNGVIAERRVLEPFQREPAWSSRFYQDGVLIGAGQQDYAPPIVDSELNAASTPILCFIYLLLLLFFLLVRRSWPGNYWLPGRAGMPGRPRASLHEMHG